jgi:hypothetical protein
VSLKDKLEVGLRPDAPYRKDNLPEFQQDDPACEDAARPNEAADTEHARQDCDDGAPAVKRGRRTARRKTTRRVQ